MSNLIVYAFKYLFTLSTFFRNNQNTVIKISYDFTFTFLDRNRNVSGRKYNFAYF
jgi:hypothetical protein